MKREPFEMVRRRLRQYGLVLIGCVLAVSLWGCNVVVQQPVEVTVTAAQVETPILAVSLDPVSDTAFTGIAVDGLGWPAGQQVLISLLTTEDEAIAGVEPVVVVAEADGSFEQTLLIPAEVSRAAAGLIKVTAQTADGAASSQAFFDLSPQAVVGGGVATATARPIGTVTATSQADGPVLMTSTSVNVRSGPGTSFSVLGTFEAGQSAPITGVSADRAWWQINYPDSPNERGWINAQFVSVQNTENVAVVVPPTPPTATPNPITEWRAEYFDNPDLSGSPEVVRNDAGIDFDWGTGSPAPGVPVDDFSVRWTRELTFPEGNYRFYALVDDGVRVWIDDTLIIDHWQDGNAATYSTDRNVNSGAHEITVEYYDRTAGALAQVGWQKLEGYPDWMGEYFDNPDVNGVPVLIRNDPNIRFSWGPDSPAADVPADGFSARWSRRLNFDEGFYRFSVLVDDGVRLWIDGQLLIDQWRSSDPQTYTAELYLTDGDHDFRVDYFDLRFDAQIRLSWEEVAELSGWKAEYYDNDDLDDDPVLIRNESEIDYDWGRDAPAPGVPTDGFSVRWTREVNFEAGRYRFETTSDDGVRLWIDNTRLIDDWADGRERDNEVEVDLPAGAHLVRLEYYDYTGGAEVRLDWAKIDD